MHASNGQSESQNLPQTEGAGSGLANLRITRDFAGAQCELGPAELCDLLADLFADCDAADGGACFALGQFVADNPPRAMIATVFFVKACHLGDRDACAYMEKVQGAPPQQRCADDPFVCSWRAMRTQDLALFDEACALGVGDACSWISHLGGDKLDDAAKSQIYLEKACQLGVPQACAGLANRLSRECEPQELGDELVTPCYPIDEGLAEQARAIGCEAGWGAGCRYN